MRRPAYERVMAKSRLEGNCLVFTGGRIPTGYGHTVVPKGRGPGYRSEYVHRVVWMHHHGPIPTGVGVLHHCDNPPCVTIEHMFLGTPADNARDRNQKGRQARGEGHPNAKLTEAAVRDVRARYATVETVSSLARQHGVVVETMWGVVTRKSWKHIK